MPQGNHFSARNRIQVELAEAGVEQGFSLVDLAESASSSGRYEESERILEAAERVLRDIEGRLSALDTRQRVPFGGLLEELQREMRVARGHIRPH